MNLNQWVGFMLRCDLYATEVDHGKNCYSCEKFGHLVKNCKNQEIIGQGRRLKYKNNVNSN